MSPDDEPFRDPPQVVGAAFLLALLGLLLPLAYLGAGFAGVVLVRRGRRPEGTAVLLLGAVCVAIGIVVRTA